MVSKVSELAVNYQENFGDFADEALTQTLQEFIKDKERASYASTIIRALLDGNAITREDFERGDILKEIEDEEAASKIFEEDAETAAIIDAADEKIKRNAVGPPGSGWCE